MNNLCKTCGLETQNPKFCSRSCSVSFHNKGRNRHGTKVGNCISCDGRLTAAAAKYCSKNCEHDHKKFIIDEQISKGIYKGSNKRVKEYLVEIRGNKCEKCSWCEINPVTNKVPIEMNHIDGDASNNSLNNLELICPNCHSLTPTYKALNMGNGRHKRMIRYHEGKSF